MASPFVLLVLLVVAVRLLLQYLPDAPPTKPSDDGDIRQVELSFWSGLSLIERLRFASLVQNFQTSRSSRRLADLRRLGDESRVIPLPVINVRRFTRGMKDVCAFQLPDGRQLEVNIYDPAQAQSMVKSWHATPNCCLRLTWVSSLGWRCSLHEQHDSHAAPAAQALAYSAAVTTW